MVLVKELDWQSFRSNFDSYWISAQSVGAVEYADCISTER